MAKNGTHKKFQQRQQQLEVNSDATHPSSNQIVCNISPLYDLQGTQEGKERGVLLVQSLPILHHLPGCRDLGLGDHGDPLKLSAAEPEGLSEDRPGCVELNTHNLYVVRGDVVCGRRNTTESDERYRVYLPVEENKDKREREVPTNYKGY